MPTKYGIDTPEDREAKRQKAEQEEEDRARQSQEYSEELAEVIDAVLEDYISAVGGEVTQPEDFSWYAPCVHITIRHGYVVAIDQDKHCEYSDEVRQMAEAIHEETGGFVDLFYTYTSFGNNYQGHIAKFGNWSDSD